MIDRWVFAYGSLMWNPEFSHVERCRAVLEGYERAFCVYSTQYRGTPTQPGLTLGLVRGGRVEGFAYRVAGRHWAATYAALIAREQSTGSYTESLVPVILADDRLVEAMVFVAADQGPDRAHIPDLRAQADIISRCSGERGSNMDYLRYLVQHLDSAEIADENIRRVWKILCDKE